MSIIFQSKAQVCLPNPQKTMYVEGDWMHINAQTAQEAIEQYECIHHKCVRIAVYMDCEQMFLDAEGSAELCRLIHIQKKTHENLGHVVPVLPCDYSICMLASRLNIEHVEIMLGNPMCERGIVRPKIMQKIIHDAKSKIIAGGKLSEQEVELLISWGCIGVQQYSRDVS